MPMFRSFVPRKMQPDLSLHCRHFPAVGRGVYLGRESDDRQYVADARRYPDVYVRQPDGHGNLLPRCCSV